MLPHSTHSLQRLFSAITQPRSNIAKATAKSFTAPLYSLLINVTISNTHTHVHTVSHSPLKTVRPPAQKPSHPQPSFREGRHVTIARDPFSSGRCAPRFMGHGSNPVCPREVRARCPVPAKLVQMQHRKQPHINKIAIILVLTVRP